MTNTGDGSASSTEEKIVISADFADKLFHASHRRTWFRIIFEFLRPNQADRIELRSFCKLFRDILPPPSQIWMQFPHSEYTTWESLIDAVNASWKKDMKKAPTLIVVRRREEQEEGEYVPFFEVVGEGAPREYQRIFRLRTFDCSANGFVREIAGDGETDEIVLPSLKRVAHMLFKEGKYSASEKLHRRVLKVDERVSGVDHTDTLNSVAWLGLLLQEQGKLEEAEVLSRRALEGCERVFGVDHPHTLTSVNNLGGLLEEQGKLEEAEVLSRRALEGQERVLGVDHPNTLASVGNLGGLLQAQGKLEEAEVLYRRALEVSERVLGTDHPNTQVVVGNLGMLLKDQGKLEEAEMLLRRALEGEERVSGVNHPDMFNARGNLGLLLMKRDDESGEEMVRDVLSSLLSPPHSLTEAHPWIKKFRHALEL